ncbi:MAG TPA: oligosaccharide flippase family protein [Vicinamibacteria bacterium]|nr:oligosaccharide flippase family protein [Vicinamibacteria bacterium]
MIWNELKKLASHSAIYGVADVIPYFVNFLLLPVFTAYLGPNEYGALGILLLFGVLTKIFFRLGLDAGFFRVYYEQTTERDRKLLATTLFLFSLATSLVLFIAASAAARPISRALLGESAVSAWIVLVALDTLLNTFAFVPINLFRIEGRPRAFTLVTLVRSTLSIGLKLALVVGGFGVSGVLWADVLSSAAFVAVLSPTLARNLTVGWSWPLLKQAAAFGLPKVPHGLAHQVLNLSDRKLLEVFASLSASGLYHVGYMLGTGVKFFLAAFELAWGPFVYAQLAKPDAPRILGRIATYPFAALVGFGLVNAIFGRELLFLMAEPRFHDAHSVVPVVVLAYVLQGVFALTSIGIGISKNTRVLPAITFGAASVNVILNILWIPRLGILGAAWATVAGYFFMALLGFYFGNRFYPIPFELGRLTKVGAAAGVAFWISLAAPADWTRALLVKGAAVLAFPLLLYAVGFFRPDELAVVRTKLLGRCERYFLSARH